MLEKCSKCGRMHYRTDKCYAERPLMQPTGEKLPRTPEPQRTRNGDMPVIKSESGAVASGLSALPAVRSPVKTADLSLDRSMVERQPRLAEDGGSIPHRGANRNASRHRPGYHAEYQRKRRLKLKEGK